MEMRITNEPEPKWHGAIVARMGEPRLGIDTRRDYPDFDTWAKNVYRQLDEGKKRAMVALKERRVIGVVLYQQHKDDPRIVEIRNITVAPEESGRLVGSFLLRQVAVEGVRDFVGIERLITDTKVGNRVMIEFLLANRFCVEGVRDLYGKGAGVDVVMGMDVRRLRKLS